MNRRAVQITAIAAVALFGVWLLFYALPRRFGSNRTAAPATAATNRARTGRKGPSRKM